MAVAIIAPPVAAYWAESYAINLTAQAAHSKSFKEAFQQTPFVIGMSFTIPYNEEKSPTNNYENSSTGISEADLDNLTDNNDQGVGFSVGSMPEDFTGLYFDDPKEAALYAQRRGSFGPTEVICAFSPIYSGGFVLPLIATNTMDNCNYVNHYSGKEGFAYSTQFHYNVLGLNKADFTMEGHNHVYNSEPSFIDQKSSMDGFVIKSNGTVIRWNSNWERQSWKTTIDNIDFP